MDKETFRVGPAGLILLVVLLGAGAVLSWRACHVLPQQSTLTRIRQTGVVRMGYANEAPFGYLDSRTGQITGEAPEVAAVILRRMGARQIIPVVTEFGSLIPGLKAGRFDVIAAGMYITRERAAEVDFSHPTYMIGEAFLVARGNPLDLHSFAQVAAHPQARLGVVGGSVEHGYARELGVPDDRIIILPDYASGVDALKAGRVDAVAATVLTVNDLLSKSADAAIERAEPFSDPVIEGRVARGYGAFAFRPQDDAFRQEFNRHLAAFLGTDEHRALVAPFGFTVEMLPDKKTAEEVLQSQ